ncbi:MAG TPA: DUF2062 domain-containing protein [Pararhizobium sp.]|uniref:DUF2062 domain-containing protein n=1 Tax=Pararhizobium sp. TaxID=1977563 RepID=UPI002B89D665|nr:DUF2062 domain-containing protein [Pararhizobium sp.]HTO29934.1 DUF2062 domain-containing protein [Pararhizobium sp.]
MLFRRKKPATLSGKLREFLWPRKGFSRGLRYMSMRVLRLSSSPHSIAVGVAAGAASSATPFVGLHIVLALALAYLLSGNLIAAGISTALANPLTIPVILAATYELGVILLGTGDSGALQGQDILHMLKHLELSHLWTPVLKPMLVGSIPLAAGSAVVFYVAAFHAAKLFQARRQIRRLGKLQARMAGSTDGL